MLKASNSAVTKREKSVGEFVMIIALVAIMMAIAVFYFIKNKDTFAETRLSSLNQLFASKIVVVKSKWLLDHKPQWVQLAATNDAGEPSKSRVFVNKAGWVDSPLVNLACEDIWTSVLSAPLEKQKEAIVAIEISRSGKPMHYCRYRLSSGAYFDYDAATGKVTPIKFL